MLGRSSYQLSKHHFASSLRAILANPPQFQRVYLHGSSTVQSLSPLRMPALSPTMESGQITSWKIRTGDRFSAGDILLTVETDKAEVDVEAQDDGYMGPQLFGPGSSSEQKTIDVGALIAVLGEELEEVQGNVDIPAEWTSGTGQVDPSSQKETKSINQQEPSASSSSHSQALASLPKGYSPKTVLPLSPAVSRILIEFGVADATKIKGTGLHGRLTKGDVLTHLGKASSPSGSAQKMIKADADARAEERSKLGSSASRTAPDQAPLMDGPALRQFITEGLSGLTRRRSATKTPASFESVLQDYGSSARRKARSGLHPLPPFSPSSDRYFEGLDRF